MEGEEPQNTQPEEQPQPDKWYTPLTRPTPLSKYLALALFVVLPFVGFWLGVGFEEGLKQIHEIEQQGGRTNNDQLTNDVVGIQAEVVHDDNDRGENANSVNKGEDFTKDSFMSCVGGATSTLAVGVTYILEPTDSSAPWGTANHFDRAIVRISGLDRSVVLPSIKAVFNGELAKSIAGVYGSSELPWNLSFKLLAQPQGTGRVVFYAYLDSTGGGAGPYFVYDVSEGTVAKFVSGDYFNWSPPCVSRDQRYAVDVPIEYNGLSYDYSRVVHVVDFVTDTAIQVAELREGESLIRTYLEYAGIPVAEFSWVDENTLVYSVYDVTGRPVQSVPPNEYTDGLPLKEKRTARIIVENS